MGCDCDCVCARARARWESQGKGGGQMGTDYGCVCGGGGIAGRVLANCPHHAARISPVQPHSAPHLIDRVAAVPDRLERDLDLICYHT